MTTVKNIRTISAHKNDINCCVFTSDGKAVVSASADKTTRVFNVKNGKELVFSPLCEHIYSVTTCALSPIYKILATGSRDCTVILWEVTTGRKITVLMGCKGAIRCCSFSENLPYLATCSEDSSIMVWNILTYELLNTLRGSEFALITCRFTPDDLYIISGSLNGDIRVWDLNSSKCMNVVLAHDCGASGVGLSSCDFSPKYGAASNLESSSGKSVCFFFATCGGDNLVKLWNLYTASAYSEECSIQPYSVLEGHSSPVSDCKFSINGDLLGSCSVDKSVILWDPEFGKVLTVLTGHTRYITCIAFSPDGRHIATGSNDKTLRIWEIEHYQKCSASSVIKTQCSTSVNKWTVHEVCVWLSSIGFDIYIDVFTRNAIDGAELMLLDDYSLSNGLNIVPLGHRNKIIREIRQLMSNQNKHQSVIPHEYLCPITLELMTDPVIAADGYTYERAFISMWLDAGNETSPMTNAPLANRLLVPNRSLKNIIKSYFEPAGSNCANS
ncbi:WD repeat, SAM and U-box domain-containing protein 1 isoform X1 [Hydra vulgaris]|uniref:WD repeat, SAM and U-box domain-containing protein 1 n=1 Tax=Hydra vulgaris TaxID=6087 RepID=T2M9U1_HYDVU|nr:WD repeat, SAM and U-box domain-containing protein 1 [Hydra vulgaris]